MRKKASVRLKWPENEANEALQLDWYIASKLLWYKVERSGLYQIGNKTNGYIIKNLLRLNEL